MDNAKLDAALSKMDSLATRMDAYAKADADENINFFMEGAHTWYYQVKGKAKVGPFSTSQKARDHAKANVKADSAKADASGGSWAKDPKTGKELNFSTPFGDKESAAAFAQQNGLSRSNVRSRPSGWVVER